LTREQARAVADAWPAAPVAASIVLGSVKEIREALAAVLLASLDPAADQAATGPQLGYLWLRRAAAAGRFGLVPAGPGRPGARLVVRSAPGLLIADRAASAAIELLCEADLTRLGVCPPEQHGCGWLFLGRSRNGSRRWCTTKGCARHA
jgi:predicted RNA-binding Zn ribbon-like protein